jgi:hypothetical protein
VATICFANLLREVPVHVIVINAALLGAAIYGLEQAVPDASAEIKPRHLHLADAGELT